MSSKSEGDILLNSFFIAINTENILYGIELLLYVKTLRLLLRDRGTDKKDNLFYAVFSSVMMLLITVWIATQAVFGENMWVLEYGFPGGPFVYWSTNIGVWYMTSAMIAVIILQLMTDALMIHRCRIIWNSYRVVVVPIVLWLATLTLGVLLAWSTSAPATSFHSGIATQISLAYWSVSVFLNTTLTSMICWRVLRHGRKVQERIGKEYASLYFAVATIVVESVLPYTLSGIAFLVTFGADTPTAAVFLCVYFMFMCISPQMLIFRVAAGKAWDNKTFSRPGSTIKFSPEEPSQTGSNGPPAAVGQGSISRQCRTSVPDGYGKVRFSEV
ncbi:hypothetical protein EV363DRAFT_1450697 [Boletus edulis]|nr:hypothetical protein EV363DRAFT_1450697 [Boletus edulis]